MNRYVVTPLAQGDLDEIWERIAQHSLRAADRQMAVFKEQFELLADYPEIGPIHPECGGRGQ